MFQNRAHGIVHNGMILYRPTGMFACSTRKNLIHERFNALQNDTDYKKADLYHSFMNLPIFTSPATE